MKECSKCNIKKDLSEYSTNRGNKSGLSYTCKECARIASAKWRVDNSDRQRVNCNRWYTNNKERVLENTRKWRKNNPGARAKESARYRAKYPEKSKMYLKAYRDRNREKLAKDALVRQKNNLAYSASQTAKRRATKLNATPKWLTKFDLDYIKHLYLQSQELSKITEIEHNVDHIIPLQGKTVCGLHIPWNLQVITAEYNRVKSNEVVC